MQVSYEPWLVLLSIVMAIQGGYVGLSLAVQVDDADGLRRRLLLAGAAFSLALGIWTMHFIGMLAAVLPFPVDYLVLPTLLSFLVCVIVVGIGVYATSTGPLTPQRLILSSCLTGVGVFSMHYIGMTALDGSARMVNDPVYVVGSLAIAIAASALGALARRRPRQAAAHGAVGDRVRYRGLRPALYGHGRHDSVPAARLHLRAHRPCRPTCSPSWSQWSRSASLAYSCCSWCPISAARKPVCRHPSLANGFAAAAGFPAGLAASRDERGRRGRRRRRLRPRHLCPARGLGRTQAEDRPPVARSSTTAPPATSRSRTWSLSTPTPTTRPSSMAAPSCSARSPSATWNRGSTRSASSACTAATSSISSASSATSGRVTVKSWRWRRAERYTVPVSRSRVAVIKARIEKKSGTAAKDQADDFRTAK